MLLLNETVFLKYKRNISHSFYLTVNILEMLLVEKSHFEPLSPMINEQRVRATVQAFLNLGML